MERALVEFIERQARKLLRREEKKRYSDKKYQKKYWLRSGRVASVANYEEPKFWALHPHFDPKYCISHSKFLAKIIWRKVLDNTYEPIPAVRFDIPKDDGGTRQIMVFGIPDAALANMINQKLRDRNTNILSPFCFSYLKHRGLFDAVIQLGSYIKEDKTYIVQYDFKKFFDSIDHAYLEHVMEKKLFLMTSAERNIIKKFLIHKHATKSDYANKKFSTRNRGVPQGCSLSLFLSNLAGHELDQDLSRKNGRFVRFADDVVCVTHNHNDAISVVDSFRTHCRYSGISINYEKSPGITMLETKERRSFFVNNGDGDDIRIDKDFDYIGHKFTMGRIGVSSRAIKRIKARISRIIHIHLLLTPKSRKLFDSKRIGDGFFDWDLVTCINEIRRYIYGGLRTEALIGFIDDNRKLGQLKGVMGFYPLVTNVDQFSKMDGWMINSIRRALNERYRLLATNFELGNISTPTKAQIVEGSWYGLESVKLDTKIPSFVLAWRASRKSFQKYGLTNLKNPSYYSSMEGLFGNTYD